jgi:hypothetical protein
MSRTKVRNENYITLYDPLVVESRDGRLTFLGGDRPGGTYVLRVRVMCCWKRSR